MAKKHFSYCGFGDETINEVEVECKNCGSINTDATFRRPEKNGTISAIRQTGCDNCGTVRRRKIGKVYGNTIRKFARKRR